MAHPAKQGLGRGAPSKKKMGGSRTKAPASRSAKHVRPSTSTYSAP